jgi:hypothetical protein
LISKNQEKLYAYNAQQAFKSSYDDPFEDRTKKPVPPQSRTEEIYEDYLLKIKNSNIPNQYSNI